MSDDIIGKLLRTESVFRKDGLNTLAQNFVPEKLLRRDDELKQLIAIHKPILHSEGTYSANSLILGRGGIGKTVTAKYFGRKIREAALKKDVKLLIEYYDCLQHRSKSSILRNIAEKLNFMSGHGYSDNEIIQQILKYLTKSKRYLLIILDEVHNLPSADILSLLNASIGYGEYNSRFSIVCISRNFDWYKVENEKITSRIQKTIKMEPYQREGAFEILKYRKNTAFRDGVITDDSVELIAEIVADLKNMRNGIDILRDCGLKADEERESEIPVSWILESRNQINPTFKAEIIDNLKHHEKVTLLALARTIKLSGEPYTMVDPAYEQYEIICDELNSKPHVKMSFRKYIRNLNDVKAISVEYLNPTQDKKGRQIKVRLLDIEPAKLAEYLVKSIPEKED